MKYPSLPRWNSLSGKLVLLFILMAFIFVVMVGGSFSKVFRDHFEHNIQPHLVQYINYIRQDIGLPPNRIRAAELAKQLKVDIYITGPEESWSSNGRQLSTSKYKLEHSFVEDGIEYGFSRNHDEKIFMARMGENLIYFDIPNIKGEQRGNAFIPIAILLILLFGLYYLILRLIQPINTLINGVRQFGQGDINHRIDLNRRDEIGELANSYNQMADDIQQMLDAKRQLLLAISHELRSPLTRAKVSLEFMIDNPHRQELARDLNEMESLIEELLESERLTNHHQALNKQEYNLNELIEELIQHHFSESHISLQLPEEPIILMLDGPRIRLLLKNLLENGLRHTPGKITPPRIKLEKQDTTVLISVHDSGKGIDAQHIPHLTEPFYRADVSRHRETGGYGLGLYLCQVIVEAHGGELTIRSETGKGTTVYVQLPD